MKIKGYIFYSIMLIMAILSIIPTLGHSYWLVKEAINELKETK